MTLAESAAERGVIIAVSGEGDERGRLIDLGLLGCTYTVRARRGTSLLIDFGTDFSAVIELRTAQSIRVSESK